MPTTKRPCIEVDVGTGGETSDPIGLFARMLRSKYGGSEDSERSNRELLERLIKNGQIPKSSIVWHGERVSKIHGFKVDAKGRIEYDSPSKGSPPKRPVARAYAAEAPDIDVLVLKDAILRSKQMAI